MWADLLLCFVEQVAEWFNGCLALADPSFCRGNATMDKHCPPNKFGRVAKCELLVFLSAPERCNGKFIISG
jgi:hypothetical protein